MDVFLTGATGFVGSHMLERLLRQGHRVHALLRDPATATPPTHGPGSVEFFPGDVVSGEGIGAAVTGCRAVIHLVGIIMEVGDATFEKVHHQGTRNVIRAAQQAGISRFVQMSALGASAGGVSGYQTSKWRAEEAVRASTIPYTVLRPSIIFGPRDGFVSQMVQVMKSAPLIRPVVGTGKYPFRPIFIDNVVDCFVQSLTSERAVNQTVDLGGPQELTLDQMLDAIASCAGVRKPALHVPFGLMYMNAALLGMVLRRSPVTTDQLRMLRQGSTCDIDPMLSIFDVDLVDFRSGLQKYLCA